VRISQDYEYEVSDPLEGAHYQFVAKPGRVTLLHLHCTTHGWQGLSPVEPRWTAHPGSPAIPTRWLNSTLRLQVPAGVASVGSTQHWIMAYGDHLSEIENVFNILGLPLLSIGRENIE